MGRWQSGQLQLTVNQPTSVYGGSIPSLPTVTVVVAAVVQFPPKVDNLPAGRQESEHYHINAWVAQLVEHIHGKDEVTGSIPVSGSKFINNNILKLWHEII